MVGIDQIVFDGRSKLNKTSDSPESHSQSIKIPRKPETQQPETQKPETPKTETLIPLTFAEPLPDYFKEKHEWDVGILKAPSCPNVDVIRFIKSSPFNSDLRRYIRSHMKNQGASNKGVFFLIGLHDPSDQATAQKRFTIIHRLNSEKFEEKSLK